MKLRVAIREQLAALVVFAVLVGLAIVSVPVWLFVNRFVVSVESQGLALTASLKAAMISSELDLIQSSCQMIASRLLIQTDITNFYNKNWTNYPIEDMAWKNTSDDLKSALNAVGFTALFQARIYSRNTTGDAGGLVNITSPVLPPEPIILPYALPNGTRAVLGDTDYGYPPSLFPNITFIDQNRTSTALPSEESFAASPFPEVSLTNVTTGGGLLLGPLVINQTFALVSVTIPIRSNNFPKFVLGYITLVASARSMVQVQTSQEGLGSTGTVLIVGSDNPWNIFNKSLAASTGNWSADKDAFANQSVQFILPPIAQDGQDDRHSDHNFVSGRYNAPFAMKDYPAVLNVLYNNNSAVNNASATLSTTNEQGHSVAVGAARPSTTLVSWAVLVEQDDTEAFEPIKTLQNILLGCVFATAGLVLLLIVPCAHISVMPIRRLKDATEKSIAPPGYEDEFDDYDEENPSSGGTTSGRSEKGLYASIRRRIKKRRKARLRAEAIAQSNQRGFKIPARVDSRQHFITDELTELTDTFNAMTDELLKQYTSLDEKVAERTRELEISKKAAEAANESKTLFIANISHELKTPLNGIMGMCAVCMEEDDLVRIKQSLKTLYKSGDLLLHLLDDLLNFSKNQIGQQLSLEEREFRLGEIRSQMLSIFDKQVRENKINYNVTFVGPGEANDPNPGPERTSLDKRLPALGPPGIGRLKDMCLWGDQHRILQVIINLVSNSLKFTPAGGKVDLRIRCLGEVEQISDDSRTSSLSKTGSNRAGRTRHRVGSSSTQSVSVSSQVSQLKAGTALAINPLDPKATPHVRIRERSPTPPPVNAKTYLFEFEVEDTGPGIAEHMQEKIFEPFVQGDLGLSKKFGGTGLGLSICSQLATIMGGSVSLKSTVGVGTTFTMQIPLKYVKDRASSTASSSLKSRPPSVGSLDGENVRNSLTKTSTTADAKGQSAPVLDTKQPRLVGLSQPFFASNPNPQNAQEDHMAVIERARANKSDQGKLRVLVADDNSTNIEVVSRLLKLEDIYDVTIAKDGQEAFDLVKANMENNQRFDVIFMDIQMPNLDGLQSTRLIRKMGYSAPIVALTAFSEESNVKECMESGMDEFLSKPIRRPALKQVLKKFATIPEEPETMSLTRRTTPEKAPSENLDKQIAGPPVTAGNGKIELKSNGSAPTNAPISDTPVT